MNSEEVIKEKLEFLKLEYGQLKSHSKCIDTVCFLVLGRKSIQVDKPSPSENETD